MDDLVLPYSVYTLIKSLCSPCLASPPSKRVDHLPRSAWIASLGWESSEQKDKCIVCLNDLERAYWMGTEIGQWEAMDFKE